LSFAKRLSNLRDPERRLFPGRGLDIAEIDKNSLRGLGTKISHRSIVFDWAHKCLKHEIELTRFGKGIAGATVWTSPRNRQLIGTEALLAFATINQWVSKSL
jgi:hypothetical protein